MDVVEALLVGQINEVVSTRAISDHEEGNMRAVAELLSGLDDDFEALKQPMKSEIADQEIFRSDTE